MTGSAGRDEGGVSVKACSLTVWTMDTLCGATWQSKCACGWVGEVRREQLGETFLDAERDVVAHLDAATAPLERVS